MAKYPYVILPPEDNPVFKPLVAVSLGYKKTHKVIPYAILSLIDSGADMCLCKKYIGDWLGINFKKAKEGVFRAANGEKVRTLIEKITIYFQSKTFESWFYFTDRLPDETPIILGQKGFFNHFKITFDLLNKEIEIV